MNVLRPYGVIIDGRLEHGLELVFDGGEPVLRPHTGIPGDFVVSAAFVNAHSHLEYRGLQDTMTASTYVDWLAEIIVRKREQTPEQVRHDAILAAHENRRTGVALIAEHSDRPYAGEAMRVAGLSGIVFQELITFAELENPGRKVAEVLRRARANREALPADPLALNRVSISPHAPFTVDEETLGQFSFRDVERALRIADDVDRLMIATGAAEFGFGQHPAFSIHVAETPLEDAFFRDGTGPIADLYAKHSYPVRARGIGVVEYLRDIGLVRDFAQFVHCCALSELEVGVLAEAGVRVAHCPRSNRRLGCPAAPVREMIDAGILVGLGMDSPASGGPIDMFDEMRAALAISHERGRHVTAEEVWRMATTVGALSLGVTGWGFGDPLIAIHVPGAQTTEDLIERGAPHHVEWIETS